MKEIGFVISHKENEKRRALIPEDIEKLKFADKLWFEKGYGDILGYSDSDYLRAGAHVGSAKEVYAKEVICNPKFPETDERSLLSKEQVIFGWIHAVQGKEITDFLMNRNMTAIAWEDMFEKGRHVFWRNNELSGEAAVIHAIPFFGRSLYDCRAAVIGRGNAALGAIRILERLGASVRVYNRRMEQLLRDEISSYDIVVNAVLWDVFRNDRLLYKDDIKKMRKGSMIIDISCNHTMELETSHPTPISDPVYVVDGVLHYSADHTPSLLWKTATESISKEVSRFIDIIVEGKEKDDPVLREAIIIEKGKIIDQRISRFQNR